MDIFSNMSVYFNQLVSIGVDEGMSNLQKRSVILSNYLAWILILINLLLFALIPINHTVESLERTLIILGLFLIPFLLNKLKLFFLNHLYLSWVPPIIITSAFINALGHNPFTSVTTYDGFRYYIIACGSIPFILFERNRIRGLILAVIPSFALIIFCDNIFTFFNVGIEQVGVQDPLYFLTTVRSILAYSIITASSFSLRYLVDKSDEDNKQLLDELAEKNKEILAQSDKNLSILNEELKVKINELEHREFMLNQSQKVAKIGSWECTITGDFTFWSKEMYNIFEMDENIKIDTINFSQLSDGEESAKFDQAIKQLLLLKGENRITLTINTVIGYKKWVEFFFFVVTDAEDVSYIRGVCHDITYLKESDLLLRKSESNYKGLFKQSFYPIILINNKGLILDANESFSNLIQIGKTSFIYQNITQFLNVDFDNIIDYANTIDYSLIESTIRTNQGEVLEIEVTVNRLDTDQITLTLKDVTNLRLAERKTIESEIKFRTSFESSSMGMAILSLEGYFLEVNDQLTKITGYSEEELKKLSSHDITHADDLENDVAFYEKMKTTGDFSGFLEKRLIHKSGAVVWVYASVSLVFNSDRMPLYFVGQLQDITDRKISEANLIEAEYRFRTLVEKSLVGVYIIKNGHFEYVNPAFAEIFEYSQEEVLLLDSFVDIIHEEDIPKVSLNTQEIIEGNVNFAREELKGITKSGLKIWIDTYGSKIVYKGADAIIGTLTDISERKAFEKEQALLSSVVESIDEAIISISIDGYINSWNQGACKIFGIEPLDAINKRLNMILPVELLPNDVDLDSIMSGDFLIENLEKVWYRADEIKNISISFFPLMDRNNDVIGSTIVARDITFQKQSEKELKESEERYRELIENAPDAIFVLNTTTFRLIQVSKSTADLFKTTTEHLLEIDFFELSPKFQPNGNLSREVFRKNAESSNKSQKFSLDWMHIDVFGNEIPCEVRLTTVPSKSGNFLRCSVVDISERIEREKLLAEANKKMGEFKLMALRSAMSPHFIFNVLNSIQYFIGKNDRLNANNYLSTFSKLIRSILTHSVDNKIKLSDEIEMLKNYVNLEMLRFEDKFEFDLIVDEELEIDSIEVPSLLIQPYVENAILHGLYNKKGKGRLILEIFEKDDILYFKIEDNGIGRAAAMSLAEKNFSKHKSMGLTLTEERLNLINEDRKISFFIDDLMDGNEPIGTAVTIGVYI